MTSLAFFAAPIGQETYMNNEPIDNKRTNRTQNKTIKRYSDASNKVENMRKQLTLQGIDNSQSQLADFNPPDLPQSAGTERIRSNNEENVVQPAASNHNDSPVNVENFNTLPDMSEDYYKQYIPYYDRQTDPDTQHALINKLDYMIHLLEQQKEQKTESATEEIILYSFLGIFIIFVLDTFARAGKYTR